MNLFSKSKHFRDLQDKSFKYFKDLAKTLCLIMV